MNPVDLTLLGSSRAGKVLKAVLGGPAVVPGIPHGLTEKRAALQGSAWSQLNNQELEKGIYTPWSRGNAR